MTKASETSVGVRAVRFWALSGTLAKARRLHRPAGACQFIWNELLDQEQANRRFVIGKRSFPQAFRDCVRTSGGRPSAPTSLTLGKAHCQDNAIERQRNSAFTHLRRSNDATWLQESPFAVVRYTFKRQVDAWQPFFKEDGVLPKFKERSARICFTIPNRVRIRNGCIAVPRAGEHQRRMAQQTKGGTRRRRTRDKHFQTCHRIAGIRSNTRYQASRRFDNAARDSLGSYACIPTCL